MKNRAIVSANFPQLAPFETIFDDWFLREFPQLQNKNISFTSGAYPKMDAYEYQDSIKLVAEVPGLSKSDISISVEKNILSITGNKRQEKECDEKECKVIWKEIKKSSFNRKVRLDDKLDGDNIAAKFEDGVLTISIPKITPDDKIKKEIEIE